MYDLIDDSGSIVLRARANRSAASLRHSVYADPARTPILRWRWRTDHVLQAGDITTKEGDDYAARVYVFFDRDPETMTLKERTLLKLGRARYGNDLPAAALCYVWDNRQPVGTILPNVYTPFVAMVVASSGDRRCRPLGVAASQYRRRLSARVRHRGTADHRAWRCRSTPTTPANRP